MNARALRKFKSQAAKAAEATWPGIVTIGGKDYDCTVSMQEVEHERVLGGTIETGELLVRVRKELLAEKPALRSIIEQGGRKWYVVRVEGEEEAEARWLIEANLKN